MVSDLRCVHMRARVSAHARAVFTFFFFDLPESLNSAIALWRGEGESYRAERLNAVGRSDERDLLIASRAPERNPDRQSPYDPLFTRLEDTDMWALLKSLLAQWAILKLLLKSVGSLTWLLPLAFLLKAVGLPLLLLLAMLAIPLVIVLVIIGLPIILVVVVGGALMTFTLWVVSMGLLALKVAIPVLLVFWLVRWLMRSNGGATDTSKPADAT